MLIISRGAEGPGREILQRPPSVWLCRYMHHVIMVMGVCCIVFDIDGMLFEFFMNFLNIEKNKINYYLFFSIFHVFFAFHAISNIKKKIGVKKIILSDFTFYAIFNIYWKVPLHLLGKWEVVSPNSREGQLASISIISSIPLFWFCISNVGVVWGGGV